MFSKVHVLECLKVLQTLMTILQRDLCKLQSPMAQYLIMLKTFKDNTGLLLYIGIKQDFQCINRGCEFYPSPVPYFRD